MQFFFSKRAELDIFYSYQFYDNLHLINMPLIKYYGININLNQHTRV